MDLIKHHKNQKIILIRSVIETDEKLGFLLEEILIKKLTLIYFHYMMCYLI